MKLFFAALVIALGTSATLLAADADKLMTRGRTNTRPDGTPGINYQGGVAGYAGPTQDADKIGIDVTSPEQAQANAENAKREAAIDRERGLAEQQAERAARAQRDAAKARATQQRQNDLARFCASKRMAVDYKSNACISTSGRGRAGTQAQPQRGNSQDLYGGQNSQGDLVAACGAKGFMADFVTGNCISPQSRQTNPLNLYPPFAAPLPKPQPNDLIMRCGAMGRTADFVTGRCM